MSSSAATATSTRGTGRGGGFRTAKHSSGKRRGDAAQIETTENVRVRCLGAYVMAVVTVGYAVNFVRPDFNDAYALAISQPLMASAADTVWSHYQRVANPMFAPLPANVINGLQLIYPRHITGAVFKHIFGIAGTDGEAGEILFTQVLGPLRAWCLHNSIFSDAALIAEANGHLRTAGSFPAREHFPFPTPITDSLDTQASSRPKPPRSRRSATATTSPRALPNTRRATARRRPLLPSAAPPPRPPRRPPR